jgi:diaminopimelate epimerase
MMRVPFVKYHGIGNDFAVFLDPDGGMDLPAETVRRLCDRNTGIGADGLIRIYRRNGSALVMDHRNADGSVATMCGNGLRCVAMFAHDQGLVTAHAFEVETLAGILPVRLLEPGVVEADLGAPAFAPADIPVDWDGPDALHMPLRIGDQEFELACISTGTTHAVLFVDGVDDAPVAEVGPAICAHPVFPTGTNVTFVEIVSPGRMRMRVWERGVGETRACGTGACAGAVAGNLLKGTADAVEVELPGGTLHVDWPGSNGRDARVRMTGPAEAVFAGEIVL